MRYNKNLRLFDEETEEGGLVSTDVLDRLRKAAGEAEEQKVYDYQKNLGGNKVQQPAAAGQAPAKQAQPFSYASAPQYVNQWQGLIDEATKSILNREGFSYDHTQDPLYQQLEQSYTQKGKQAMEDTLGIVSQRTGGLASSYATQAGQQAYQGYMGELADRIPELQRLAYEMYMDEGDRMMDKLSLLQGMEEQDYGRFLDTLGQHNAERNFAYGMYADELARADDLERQAYDRAWDENERAYSRAWDENERAYARGQDALARQDALSKLAYERAQEDNVPTLTWKQVKEEIEAGNTSPAVLKAYEYYMGASYEDTVDYGDGYSEDPVATGTGGYTASEWNYVLNNIKTNLREGNGDAVSRYMDQIADGLSAEQWAQIEALFKQYNF